MATATAEKDWYLVAFIVTAYIGIIIISLCTVHFIKAVRRKKNMKSYMKYPALLCLSSSLLYCIMIAFFRTNIPFRSFTFDADGLACNVSFGATYFFYIIARFSGYVLFLDRLQLVFEETPYPFSRCLQHTIRAIIFVLACIYIPGVCIFLQKEQRITPKFHIAICTVDGILEANYGDLSIICFVVTDFLLCVVLTLLYCYKLCHMSKILVYPGGDDELQQIANRMLQTQMVKSSILVITVVVTTVLVVLVGNLFIEPLSWFIPLDVTINAVCIYLMFGFSAPLYRVLCGTCLYCCRKCARDVEVEKKGEHSAIMDASTADLPQSASGGDVDTERGHMHVPNESQTVTQIELQALHSQ